MIHRATSVPVRGRLAACCATTGVESAEVVCVARTPLTVGVGVDGGYAVDAFAAAAAAPEISTRPRATAGVRSR
jgi:hypothetical protein